MEKTIFDKKGYAVAYFTDDYYGTIFLWEGFSVAYLYDENHVYGINGRHLGWFIDNILFDNNGNRIGFTSESCPVPAEKEPVKPEKYPRDEIMARWEAPSFPKLSFDFSSMDLKDFLAKGQVFRHRSGDDSSEKTEDEK